MIRALILAAIALASSVASAQEPFRLALGRGAEVRVTPLAAPGERRVGKVELMTGDTIRVLERGSNTVNSYAIRDLRLLEIRGGENKRRGVLIGAGFLGGIALVFGSIDASRGEVTGSDVFSATVGNALIGALIGYAFAPKGWERLPLPR